MVGSEAFVEPSSQKAPLRAAILAINGGLVVDGSGEVSPRLIDEQLERRV
jgi:hypothetical protein